VLVLYDPTAKLKVSADASPFGLGSVLIEENGGGEWRPVAYKCFAVSFRDRETLCANQKRGADGDLEL